MAENQKNYSFYSFVAVIVTGALLLVTVIAAVVMFDVKQKTELLNYAYNSAWKNFTVLFDRYVEYVPNRIMTKNYWKGRTWFDAETRSIYGIETLQPWERGLNADSNTVSIRKIRELRTKFSMVYPIDGRRFTSVWGYRRDPIIAGIGGQVIGFHTGIDIGTTNGTPLVAAASGFIALSRRSWGQYGQAIKIEHGDGVETVYAHLSRRVAGVGRWVEKGELIAYTGNSGRVYPVPTKKHPKAGSHLHMEIRIDGQPVNPLLFLE